MTDRPILFSGPMVRALLDGRKTQTRRIVKPMPKWAARFPICKPDGMVADHEIWWWDGEFDRVGVAQASPYGGPGDRLWVKETHAIVPRTAYAMSDGVQQTLKPDDTHDAAVYAAGWERSKPGRWRPSIHMPRWASRLTLTITDVRVERLQNISEVDARAEGISIQAPPDRDGGRHFGVDGMQIDEMTAARAYQALWNKINGPDSWAANPWVWVVTFEVKPQS